MHIYRSICLSYPNLDCPIPSYLIRSIYTCPHKHSTDSSYQHPDMYATSESLGHICSHLCMYICGPFWCYYLWKMMVGRLFSFWNGPLFRWHRWHPLIFFGGGYINIYWRSTLQKNVYNSNKSTAFWYISYHIQVLSPCHLFFWAQDDFHKFWLSTGNYHGTLRRVWRLFWASLVIHGRRFGRCTD